MPTPQAADRMGRFSVGFALLLGTAVAATAGVATLQMTGVFGLGSIDVLPLAVVHDMAAQDALKTDPARARVETVKELALQPASGRGWLRLAQIDAERRRGPLSRDALAWLGRSYELAPFDAQLLEDRTEFALDHWDDLGPDLRESVLSHVRAAWTAYPQQPRLLGIAPRVTNSRGKMAVAMQLFTLRLQDLASRRRGELETNP
jgi:hypothetical protein